MFKSRKREKPPAAKAGAGAPKADPAESPAPPGKQAADAVRRRRPNLKVNGWIVYRGTTPVAGGDDNATMLRAGSRAFR